MKGSYQFLSQSNDEKFKEKIIINATAVEDESMIDKLSFFLPDEPLHYHKVCKLNYFKQYSLKPNKNDTAWHKVRDSHKHAFCDIVDIVREEIIEGKNCLLLSFIAHMYVLYL